MCNECVWCSVAGECVMSVCGVMWPGVCVKSVCGVVWQVSV